MHGESVNGYFDVEEIEVLVDYFLFYVGSDEALEALDVGLCQHPNHPELLQKRVKVLIERGDLNEAESCLEHFIEHDSYDTCILKTEILAKFNRIEEAKEMALHILRHHDSSEAAYLDISDIFRDCDQHSTALYFIEQREKVAPLSVDMLFEKAYFLEQEGDYEQAIQTYQDIISIDSYIGEAWFNLGQVYYTLQRYDEAIHAYTMCVTINEDDPLAWIQKGHAHFLNKDADSALTCYTKCMNFYSEKWELYIFIAECLVLKKEYDKAIGFYQDSLNERSNNYKALIGLAVCHIETGNYIEAQRNLFTATNISPESYEAWFYLGEIENFQHHTQAAIEYFKKSYMLNDTDIVIGMALGHIYANMKDYDSAIPYYQKALEYADEFQRVDILVFLATCYYYIGQHDMTLYYAEKAIKQNADALSFFYTMCPEAVDTLSDIIEENNHKTTKQ